ncbi:MAG: hypothetical protein KGJ82_19340 [Nitrospirota bacterium]|nr:hypothetical protein [Nitrospirota bacterium]
MRVVQLNRHLMSFISCMVSLALMGCVAFDPVAQSDVEQLDARPVVALLPIGFDVEITKLSYVKTVEDMSPEEESKQLGEALAEIQQDARWLLLSRLAAGQGFRFIPLEETDALAEALEIKPGAVPNQDQVKEFGKRFGADIVIAVSILDYGKVRWQHWVPGLLVSMLTETLIVGAASGFNPVVMAATAGSELITDVPFWWGGAYIAGWAFRPVRVEARAFDTLKGYPIWQSMEESVYAYEALKLLPEDVRGRKETQLTLNLAEIMESLGDGLIKQGYTVSWLRAHGA